jgi:hypothetical protein
MSMPSRAIEGRYLGPRSVEDDLKIRDFLERMGHSLTSADIDTLAELWETPVFVLSDDGARVVESIADIMRYFGEAKARYHASGIVATQPDIMHIEWLTHRIAIVDVRWPHLDRDGRERSAECATYTLCFDDANNLRVRCVVMRGVTRRTH